MHSRRRFTAFEGGVVWAAKLSANDPGLAWPGLVGTISSHD